MVNIFNRMRLRELKSNFKSYISVIIISILCVALFSGLLANYKHFDEKVNAIYKNSNMGDLYITTRSYDESDFDYLKEIENVKEISQRYYFQSEYEGYKCFVATSSELSHYAEIVNGEKGVLLSEVFARSCDISIGDVINFSLDINGIKFDLSFNVTGIMIHAEALLNSSSKPGFIEIDEGLLIKEISDKYGAYYDFFPKPNQYILKCDSNIKGIVNDYYLSKEVNNLYMCLERESLPMNQTLEADLIQSKQLLFVFPVVFYLVGVLVIITSLRELIKRDRRNIGILSSTGVSKGKIIIHYAFFAILVTGIGGIIGLIIGPLIVPYVMGNKYNVLYILTNVKHPIFYFEYAICFFLLFLVGCLVSIIETYKIVRLKPNDIFNVEDSKSYNGILTSKVFNRIPLVLKISLRSLLKNISRSIMVIIGVLGCSALMACGLGIDDTLNYGIKNDLTEKMPYDIVIDNNLIIDNIQGIRYVDKYTKLNVVCSNEKTMDTFAYVIDNKNEIINISQPKKGVTISSKIASELDLAIGDKINIYYNNLKKSYEVEYIDDMFFFHGIFISKDNFLDVDYNVTYLKVEENRLDFVCNQLDELQIKYDLMETFKAEADDILSGIRIITLTVKIFAILLAIVVVYNLAFLNYKERIREIATLKVLGYDKNRVRTILMTEIMLLTIIGSILGLLCGKPFLELLLRINKTELVDYLYHIDISSYLIAFATTSVVSFIINYVISIFANKIQMAESLKSRE